MSVISFKSTGQNSLRTVMPRTSTATEICFATSVSRRLKGGGVAWGYCREVGAAEGAGRGKEWVPQRNCIRRLWEGTRERRLAVEGKNTPDLSPDKARFQRESDDKGKKTLQGRRISKVGKEEWGRRWGELKAQKTRIWKQVRTLWAWPWPGSCAPVSGWQRERIALPQGCRELNVYKANESCTRRCLLSPCLLPFISLPLTPAPAAIRQNAANACAAGG